jgi:hypothetical protein
VAHVEKRGKNRWRARYRGPDGKERSRTFDRERDANNWLATVTTSQLRGEWVDPRLGRITLKDWATQWRDTVTGIRPTTWARDSMYLDNRVLARFGDYPLNGMRHVDVRAWVALLEGEGYAAATVQKCVQILAKVMRAAVEAGMLAANTCDRVPLPRIERKEMRFLAPADVDRLADAIDPRYRGSSFLARTAGCALARCSGYDVVGST